MVDVSTPDAASEIPVFVTADVPTERPALPADFGVGSRVVVQQPSYRHASQATRWETEVVACARIWLTARAVGDTRPYPREFRLRRDTQNDGTGHYAVYFRTPEQDTWEAVHRSAEKYLRAQRVDLTGSPWQHRKLTVARALWSLDHPETVEEVTQ